MVGGLEGFGDGAGFRSVKRNSWWGVRKVLEECCRGFGFWFSYKTLQDLGWFSEDPG